MYVRVKTFFCPGILLIFLCLIFLRHYFHLTRGCLIEVLDLNKDHQSVVGFFKWEVFHFLLNIFAKFAGREIEWN